MKTRIAQLALVLIGCSSLFLTACQTDKTAAPNITLATVTADAGLALSVAAQYELAAKSGTVTPDKYISIAKAASDDYAAVHPGATATQIQQWVADAQSLVAVYDITKAVKK